MKNKNILVVFSVLFFVVFTSCKGNYDDSKLKVISPKEMQTLLKKDNVQLLDVRTPKEYSEGFIANAQNIDYFSPTFDEDIKKLDKEKPVIVYCKSGRRSAKSSEKLLDAGFVKIYDLEGGIVEWQHEGLQINKK
ncbi:rhodanese-like domain-containing protein [Yeosuana marina]|uniref:rhodanese-like domain-containing protein n=1 Tax=Yeosuana marina TaxID=1565536 RepID=UPI0030C87111